jgi:hypothetical protein
MPCMGVHGTGLARARVHGNASPALRMLGDAVVSKRHDRGDVLGGVRARLAQGINPLGRGRSGGEVTSQGVVGGVLTKHGVHRRQWRRLGCRRGGVHGRCSVG